MKLCRFAADDERPRPGLIEADGQIRDLTGAGVTEVSAILEEDEPAGFVQRLNLAACRALAPSSVTLLAPVDRQEIWAAGVTYLRSKVARMEESDFSANAYDKVYDADRPEIFFKCLPGKVVGPGAPVGIRRDAVWSVPEPELVLVLNSRGRVAGVTIGNDMSSRDIEGANLLYLPQAKIYSRSCSVGPYIVIGEPEPAIRQWTIRIEIRRKGDVTFVGSTTVSQIKRTFDNLADYLFRSQCFPAGAMLLTGTGVVPPDSFTLQEHDVVEIAISGIGTLSNPVTIV
jgi:2-dehydro-3-deoxy-D-arabinonate dehydratase